MLNQVGQLYWRDDSLSKEFVKSETREELLLPLYDQALNVHFKTIQNKYSTLSNPGDFLWHKAEYTVPYFADLIFSYKNKIFAVLFVRVENNNLSFITDYSPLLDACKKYDFIPCLLPFSKNNKIRNMVENEWKLIDLYQYLDTKEIKPIIPIDLADDSYSESSYFELYNSAVLNVVDYLVENGTKELLYNTYPGVEPSICYIDKGGDINFILLQIEAGKFKTRSFDNEIVDKLKKVTDKVQTGIVYFTNLEGFDVFPRGGKFELKLELENV